MTQHKQVSDVTVHAIDEEVRSIIDDNYERAETILKDNMEKLHVMAKALIKYETIDEQQISDIMEGRDPRPPADWNDGGQPPTGLTTGDTDDRKPEGKIGGPAGQSS